MLNDSLTGTEGSGYCCGTALCDGEEGIDNSLSRDQRHIRRKLSCIGSSGTYRPLLHQLDLRLALLTVDGGDVLCYGIVAFLKTCDGSLQSVGYHDLVKDYFSFLYSTDDVSAFYLCALGNSGNEVPLLLSVQRFNLNASLKQIGVGLLSDLLQRSLDTIIDTADQSGSQLYGHGNAGGYDRLSGTKSGGLLVYLNGSKIPVHLNDLTDQMLVRNAHNVEHVGVAHSLGNNQGSGYLLYNTFTHFCLISFKKSEQRAALAARISFVTRCQI